MYMASHLGFNASLLIKYYSLLEMVLDWQSAETELFIVYIMCQFYYLMNNRISTIIYRQHIKQTAASFNRMLCVKFIFVKSLWRHGISWGNRISWSEPFPYQQQCQVDSLLLGELQCSLIILVSHINS